MGSEIKLLDYLLFSVERVEVVVIGELSATGDLPKSKKTNPVHSIHRPKRQKSVRRVSGLHLCLNRCIVDQMIGNMINPQFTINNRHRKGKSV